MRNNDCRCTENMPTHSHGHHHFCEYGKDTLHRFARVVTLVLSDPVDQSAFKNTAATQAGELLFYCSENHSQMSFHALSITKDIVKTKIIITVTKLNFFDNHLKMYVNHLSFNKLNSTLPQSW